MESLETVTNDIDGALELLERYINAPEELIKEEARRAYEAVATSLGAVTQTQKDQIEAVKRKARGLLADSPSIPKEFYVDRSRLIEQLTKREDFLLFVRAPPNSGKTSLALQMNLYLINKGVESHLITAADIASHPSFSAAFEKLTGLDYNNYIQSAENKRYLIIDEAQYLFTDKMKDEFWRQVTKSTRYNLRLVLLGVFHARDPHNIAAANFEHSSFSLKKQDVMTLFASDKLPGLALDGQEVDAMFSYYPPINHGLVKSIILAKTKGHLGTTWTILQMLFDKFRTEPDEEVTVPMICNHIHEYMIACFRDGPKGIATVEELNTLFPRDADLDPMKKLLSDVGLGKEISVTRVERDWSASSNSVALKLVNCGFLIETADGTLSFPTPLHQTLWLTSQKRDVDERMTKSRNLAHSNNIEERAHLRKTLSS